MLLVNNILYSSYRFLKRYKVYCTTIHELKVFEVSERFRWNYKHQLALLIIPLASVVFSRNIRFYILKDSK